MVNLMKKALLLSLLLQPASNIVCSEVKQFHHIVTSESIGQFIIIRSNPATIKELKQELVSKEFAKNTGCTLKENNGSKTFNDTDLITESLDLVVTEAAT